MKRVGATLLVTVALGIASRTFPLRNFFWDKALGDVLYAVAAYLFIVLVTRRRPFPDTFALAGLYCLAIELFKLTGIPASLGRYLIARWVLGTTFSALNLVCYFAGIILIATIDRWWLRQN